MGGHAAEAVASLSQKMAKGMALRVASLPSLHAKGAQMLTEALAVSAYGVGAKRLIQEAIDLGVENSSMAKAKQAGKKRWQKMYHFDNYLTEPMWEGLRSSNKPLMNKIQIVVDLLVSLNIDQCDEWTYAWGTALVTLLHFSQWPSYHTIRSILVGMQDAHEASAKLVPIQKIYDFPELPEELPDDVFKYVYPKRAEPPVSHKVDRLRQVALHHVPLRKNSRLLLGEKKAKDAASSSSDPVNGTSLVDSLVVAMRSVFANPSPEVQLSPAKPHALPPSREPPQLALTNGAVQNQREGLLPTGLQDRADAIRRSLKPRGSPHLREATATSTPVRDDAAAAEDNDHEFDGDQADDAALDQADNAAPAASPEPTAQAPAASTSATPATPKLVLQETATEAAMRGALGRRKEHRELLKRAADGPMKKPAQAFAVHAGAKTCATQERAHSDTETAKRRKVALVSVEVEKAATSPPEPRPSCPKAHGSVRWWLGKIYANFNHCSFRVIRDASQGKTERKINWAGKHPTEREWAQALDLIEEYWKNQ